jgi:[ribosomal protein S18]-alanine N-acetyltransferase
MAAADIELTIALPSDAVDLAYLARDLIEAGLGWTYRPDRIRALIRDADAVTLIARDGPHAVGFAMMKFDDERAHLVLLAVRPTHQRRGIARRMISASNAAAFAFYRAMGFAPTLRVAGYYKGRESAVRMLRLLRSPAP